MPEPEKKRSVSRNDVITGGILVAVSLLATIQALDFDSTSRMFPAVTSGLLAIVGFAILILAVTRPVKTARVAHGAGTAALACVVIAFWAIAFSSGAGFIFPTFIMQLFLLRLTGLRRMPALIGIAALVTTVAYLMFVNLLDVPLPPSRLPAMLQGF